MTLRIGSLFSGFGGLDMAVEEVMDARTVWVSDIDPGACKILAHSYPHAPNLGDITAVDWAAVEPVDIITGGSPCQDLSHAGRRAGMTDGTRSNLWVAMREAVAVLRPSLVIWENVRGAYSASADSDLEWCPGCMGDPADGGPVLRALGRVLGDLSDLGYDAVWCGLRAADVGACHGRFRVFVVATDRQGQQQREPAIAGQVRPEPRNGAPADADGSTGRQWRFAADGEAQGGRAWPDTGGSDRAPVSLLPTPSAGAFNDGEDLDQWEARRQRVRETAANGNGFGTPLGVAVRLLPTPTTEPQTGNGHARNLGAEVRRWGIYADAIARQECTFGRPAPDPTEPVFVRYPHKRRRTPTTDKPTGRLSARFAEWMMGVPDGWITDTPGITRSEALKACGNGVVRQQAAAAIRWALPILTGERAA